MKIENIFVQTENNGLQPAPKEVVDLMIKAQQEKRVSSHEEERETEVGDIILQTNEKLLLVKPSDFESTAEEILNLLNAV